MHRFLLAITFAALMAAGVLEARAQEYKDLWGSRCDGEDHCYETSSTVTEDKATNEFVYEYRIKSELPEARMMEWEVLSKVANAGIRHWQHKVFFVLLPGQTRTFVLRTKLFPVQVGGKICVYREGDISERVPNDALSTPDDVKVVSSVDSCGVTPAYLPSIY